MKDMQYQYEPYLSRNGQEIPCFRIYSDDIVLAQTNEDLPADLQERAAHLFTHTADFLAGLKKAVAALEMAPAFHTSEGISSHDLARELSKTFVEREAGVSS